MAITVPPVRGAGDLGHVDDSNVVRQALLDLDAADTGHIPVKGDVHGFRWDETVGRRLFAWDAVNNREQMLYGDTGWRDVSALLSNGWTGSAFVRRVGQHVTWMANLNGSAASADYWMTRAAVGDGMFPSFDGSRTADGWLIYVAGGSPLPGYAYFDAMGTGSRAADVKVVPFTLPVYEASTWPTSLPGTASGSIPTGLVMETAELLPAEES